MATFEERLTKLRTKAGVSQQAIGDALNVSRWAVHNYDAGNATRRGGLYGRPQSGAGPALLELQSVKHSNRYL